MTSGSAAIALARALAEAVREFSRRSPAPRDLPFHGLDHAPGVSSAILADLADLGIFRHYSEVLVVDSGLGGPGRWLARRHGCRVAAFTSESARAKASHILTARAHLTDRVNDLTGDVRLPFATQHFTHAWILGESFGAEERKTALGEIARVLRPGGWIGVLASSDAVAEDVVGAGFEGLDLADVSALREGDSAIPRLVAERVATLLGGHPLPRELPSTPLLRWKARKPA